MGAPVEKLRPADIVCPYRCNLRVFVQGETLFFSTGVPARRLLAFDLRRRQRDPLSRRLVTEPAGQLKRHYARKRATRDDVTDNPVFRDTHLLSDSDNVISLKGKS